MASVATKKVEPQAAPPERQLKPLKAVWPHIQNGRDVGREWYVELPAGWTAQDVGDHASLLFKLVQGQQTTALKKLDRVRLVEHEGRWLIDATVGYADPTTVTLVGHRKIDLPEPPTELWKDDTHEIRPTPGGYAPFWIKTGAMYGNQVFQTAEQARLAVVKRQPVKVAQWAQA